MLCVVARFVTRAIEHFDSNTGQRERGSQTGRLDAEHVHETIHAMVTWAEQHKIASRLQGRLYLGAYAGVIWHEGAICKPRPVLAYLRVEGLRACRVDSVVQQAILYEEQAPARGL